MFVIIERDNRLFRLNDVTGELHQLCFLRKDDGGTCLIRVKEYKEPPTAGKV